jgi:predicted PurR-regulated permease PerM
MNSPSDKSQSYTMARLASFVVLLVIICVISVLFYRVMQTFILPLFLAALTVVIFKPFHVWTMNKCNGRKRLAAFLTTSFIGLLIIGPLAMFGFFAVDEGRQLMKGEWQVESKLKGLGKKFKLDIPEPLNDVRASYSDLVIDSEDGSSSLEYQEDELVSLQESLEALGKYIRNDCSETMTELHVDTLTALQDELTEEETAWAQQLWNQSQTGSTVSAQGPAKAKKRLLRDIKCHTSLVAAEQRIAPFVALDAEGTIEPAHHTDLLAAIDDSRNHYDTLRVTMLGGFPWSLAKELAHPNAQQFQKWKNQASAYLTKITLSLTGRTPALLGRLLLVLSIMLIAVYYFLLDGPEMIKTMMRLSPLDDRYETELLAEFDNVSRAVVLATLLSALAQGLLAGVGYFLFGVPSVFLLTLLTAVLAMVPFVGAAAIWVPAALYLAFFLDPPRTGAAIGLAVYGFLVVSMADNIIKPYVLHGQSNLHPLLALLSVLGGVQALGAVGILVGPMVVAFLQALLNILRKEMSESKATT